MVRKSPAPSLRSQTAIVEPAGLIGLPSQRLAGSVDTAAAAILLHALRDPAAPPALPHNRQPFSSTEFVRVRRELTDRFGGVTAHTRCTAEGFWEDDEGHTRRDEVIIVEVMVEEIERAWWHAYGMEVASRFAQEEMVIRAVPFESLTVKSEIPH